MIDTSWLLINVVQIMFALSIITWFLGLFLGNKKTGMRTFILHIAHFMASPIIFLFYMCLIGFASKNISLRDKYEDQYISFNCRVGGLWDKDSMEKIKNKS